MQRLGDILGAEHASAVAKAVALQARFKTRLGHLLTHYGLLPQRTITEAIARQYNLPLVWLDNAPRAYTLLRRTDISHYRTRHYIPFALEGNHLTLATSEPSEELVAWATRHYAKHITLAVTSPRDIRHALATYTSTSATRNAIHTLRRKFKNLSADRTMTRNQIISTALAVALLGSALFISTANQLWYVLIILCNGFYLSTLAFKLYLYLIWAELPRSRHAILVEDEDLPIYSILVPMYRESETTIRNLLRAINSLDYPQHLLDVKLICEGDDAETIATLKALHPAEYCEMVMVPPSHPRTKPKACNVALPSVRGEFVVIFDAEDMPEPSQLRKAVNRFRALPHEVACLQAPLNYYNRDENMLTRLFAIEYSALFKLMLPALQHIGIPIPLGGTSNHLRTEILREVGAWDAFNVTEDADLGIRLAYFGYRTQMLDSMTLEESPITLNAWFKQRARWIKGYLQTWLVYTRDLRNLRKRLGHTAYYGFHFFIGAPALTFLLAPVFWVIFVISFLGIFSTHLPDTLMGMCIVSLIGGIASHWLYARTVIRYEGWEGIGIRHAGVAYPFYWLLHSAASIKALKDLVFRPHHWEKTRHGVSTLLKTTQEAIDRARASH
ncbi:MAG: glycosyltransferase [Alphaproteobacteria bacterium]|nr:glycosyltransferase [Alphaproteobacteria bacterium]